MMLLMQKAKGDSFCEKGKAFNYKGWKKTNRDAESLCWQKESDMTSRADCIRLAGEANHSLSRMACEN